MKTEFDPDFGSALDAATAIRARKISSVELTHHTLRRIDAFQPKLNAYVYQLRDQALEAAKQADQAIAGNSATGVGVLQGVPINVKESFGVQGQPCTWGVPEFKNAKAAADSVPVRRLKDAGAILLGGTNVPKFLMDGQSFNEIYGVTNNPWDVARTPGGSSGGSAASLAAGMAFFSIGSDIGGSIRTPCAFCGIYGHKPTLDIVNMSGHLPGGLQVNPGFSTLLAVGGPMARTAADLEAGLCILAGFEPPDSKAFQWTLPQPRHQKLRDFRIGYVLEDPAVPVSTETKSVLEAAIRACEKAGGEKRSDSLAKGALSGFAEWQGKNLRRLAYRAMWEKFFESVDVLLLPTAFTTAFPHDPTAPDQRQIPMPEGGSRSFWDLLAYITPATLTGCPATTAPAGLSKSGLPVGLQIIGPYLEDATPIAFARLLAEEIGGFQAPAI